MRTGLLLAFCLAIALSLGMASAIAAANGLELHFVSVGLAFGLLGGIILVPLVLIYRRHPHIFEVVAMTFTWSFPIAIVSGLTAMPWFAIGITAMSVIGIFLLLVRAQSDRSTVAWNKKVFLLLGLAMIVALAVISERNNLPDDPESLIALLAENDVPTHLSAGRKLMSLGKEPFLTALRKQDPRIRGRAAHFLGILGDKSSIDILIGAADDSDPYVRGRVAFALGELKDSKAIPVLERLAKDQDRGVAYVSKESLQKFGRGD